MQLCYRPKLRGWGGGETHPLPSLQPALPRLPAPFHLADSSLDIHRSLQPPAPPPPLHGLISLSLLQFII